MYQQDSCVTFTVKDVSIYDLTGLGRSDGAGTGYQTCLDANNASTCQGEYG